MKRLAEARALFDAGYWDGAYYLGGYAAECGLKAIIADQFTGNAIPDRRRVENTYTHSLPRLVDLAGLKPALDLASEDVHFRQFWETIKEWSENSRYSEWTEAEAGAIVEALAHPNSGILQWIRAHW